MSRYRIKEVYQMQGVTSFQILGSTGRSLKFLGSRELSSDQQSIHQDLQVLLDTRHYGAVLVASLCELYVKQNLGFTEGETAKNFLGQELQNRLSVLSASLNRPKVLLNDVTIRASEDSNFRQGLLEALDKAREQTKAVDSKNDSVMMAWGRLIDKIKALS